MSAAAVPACAGAKSWRSSLHSASVPRHWARGSLGEVFDTFTVTVNGTIIPIDRIGAGADIGPFLKARRNTLVPRVATTLNNRLAKIDANFGNRGLVQPYSLVGPVRLMMARRPSGATRGDNRQRVARRKISGWGA